MDTFQSFRDFQWFFFVLCFFFCLNAVHFYIDLIIFQCVIIININFCIRAEMKIPSHPFVYWFKKYLTSEGTLIHYVKTLKSHLSLITCRVTCIHFLRYDVFCSNLLLKVLDSSQLYCVSQHCTWLSFIPKRAETVFSPHASNGLYFPLLPSPLPQRSPL